MREISLHVMDIAENGITAGADCIQIVVDEARNENRLKIEIKDNGKGIPNNMVDKAIDPFVTTRTTRRVGLGLSLLKAAAERCDGEFALASEPGKGTRVKAIFQYDHIDRSPLGDMASSVITLIAGNPDVDFVYIHILDGKNFTMDTRDIRKELGDISLTNPTVIHHLTQSIKEELGRLKQKNKSLKNLHLGEQDS